MTSPQTAVPTTFGTIGQMQRQARQLLNASLLADVSDDRPVTFCLASSGMGPLPEVMDCWAWMYVEQDSPHEAVLVLAAAGGTQALYLAVNLNERATVSALATALHDNRIEIVVASPGGATSHWLQFSPAESQYLEGLLAEFLELCLPYDPDWLFAFSPVIPTLPTLCKHLSTALADCERHSALIVQGSYDNHLKALRTALLRGASV